MLSYSWFLHGILFGKLTSGHKKTASYLHRTATTAYPCCVPALGDSAGAGRVGLAECKYTSFLILGQWIYMLNLALPTKITAINTVYSNLKIPET